MQVPTVMQPSLGKECQFLQGADLRRRKALPSCFIRSRNELALVDRAPTLPLQVGRGKRGEERKMGKQV